MSGYNKIEYTENGKTQTFNIRVSWFEMGEDAGPDKYEYPVKPWKGTLSYNSTDDERFHLSCGDHPESEIFIHPGYWSEGGGMSGRKKRDPQGEALYWKMVDMVKDGKRIDYEFDLVDKRSPKEIKQRPLPKDYKK